MTRVLQNEILPLALALAACGGTTNSAPVTTTADNAPPPPCEGHVANGTCYADFGEACAALGCEAPRECISIETLPAQAECRTTAAPFGAAIELDRRMFVDGQTKARRAVWIEHGRESSLVLDDPCCGLHYDGNAYDVTVATCTQAERCDDTLWTVRPGLADDPICGERRRCVPLPEVRVVVLSGPAPFVADTADNQLAMGTDFVRVPISRAGAFIRVRTTGASEDLVAVDHGRRYTIVTRDGRIERITRDATTQILGSSK